MSSFIAWETPEDVEKFRNYRESVEEHFGSYQMAEHFLNGLVDWNGNPINDDGTPFEEDADWYYR